MGVFDSHPYPILLAAEINSMFTKICLRERLNSVCYERRRTVVGRGGLL